MKVQVDAPAAWFLLPASEAIVTDPDLDDDPPRYAGQLRGGWGAVGDCIFEVMTAIDSASLDPLELTVEIQCAGADDLNSDQQRVIDSWFRLGELELSAPEARWCEGRHRSWGLKAAGFAAIPVQLAPVSDAIRFWYPDPTGWGPLDRESVDALEEVRDWWHGDPIATWRAINPCYGQRLDAIIRHWRVRLGQL
ncbi:hypothetical protein [uncultured Amnibacterium sp.]|uniref:hypothetical protein n=1 Tax=uncultured Amnibacterium sp. TaxID=1631851 RepID=UPI0035CA4676